MVKFGVALAAIASLGLAGCDRSDPRICQTPNTRTQSQEQVALSRAFNSEEEEAVKQRAEADALIVFMADCVHRTAYRLARSTEAAEKVAEAVVNLCEEAVTDAASARYWADKADGETVYYGAIVREMWEEMDRKALGHVVQARAGQCAAPAADYPPA